MSVTRRTATIAGVPCVVVHDRLYLKNGRLVERTTDYYTQDTKGDVWYFGEDTGRTRPVRPRHEHRGLLEGRRRRREARHLHAPQTGFTPRLRRMSLGRCAAAPARLPAEHGLVYRGLAERRQAAPQRASPRASPRRPTRRLNQRRNEPAVSPCYEPASTVRISAAVRLFRPSATWRAHAETPRGIADFPSAQSADRPASGWTEPTSLVRDPPPRSQA